MTDNATAVAQIELAGVLFNLTGATRDIEFSDLARFQQKFLFGDPSKDSNDLLSSLQVSDLSGGHGVSKLKEGTDQGRFEFGTMYWRFPDFGTKPMYWTGNNTVGDVGTGNKYVLGEFWSDTDNEFYVVYTAGLNVRRGLIFDGGSGIGEIDPFYAAPSSGNLTSLPVNQGVGYQGTHAEERFFIPQGNNGFAIITDTSVAPTEFAAPKFSAFTVFDNKLIGITTGGRMYKTYDGTTWTGYDLVYQLSKSYRIRGLVTYVDRQDEPTVYVLTDRDMWQFDPDGPELFKIGGGGWGSHPHHARGYAVWRDQLFIAVGMAVWRYTGGTWMPVGLDRDFGLPPEYHGYISNLTASNNSLYAMVQGIGGDTEYGAKSSIHEFNGSGWQTVWTQDTAVPSSIQYHGALAASAYTMAEMCMTQSGSLQTLVFGTAGSDDRIYTSSVQMENANPRSAIRRGQAFGDGFYYYTETGEFDADMYGYKFIANSVEVTIEEPVTVPAISRDTFRIIHQIDRGDWEQLMSVTAAPGEYHALFGTSLATDHEGVTLYSGAEWSRIKFRWEILRAASTHIDKPMILTNFSFNFLKTVASNDSYQVSLDLKNGSADSQYAAQEAMDFIDALVSPSPRAFTTLKVGHRIWRVWVAQNGGTRTNQETQMGIRNLSIVEIPTHL
jgi:hypothetical protein